MLLSLSQLLGAKHVQNVQDESGTYYVPDLLCASEEDLDPPPCFITVHLIITRQEQYRTGKNAVRGRAEVSICNFCEEASFCFQPRWDSVSQTETKMLNEMYEAVGWRLRRWLIS